MPENERSFSDPEGGAEGGPAEGAPRKGSDKRKRILRAAIQVFAEKGFYATRVSEIAKAAGVADGTIYLYFKNKDDVLISIFEDRITRLISFLKGELSALDDVEAKLLKVVELQAGLLEDQRDLAEVVTVNLRQSSLLLKQYAAPLFTEYLELLASVVREGQEQGLFRKDLSSRVAARALWGALDGIALTWALGGEADPATLRRAAQQTASIFLRGLRAEPTPPRPKGGGETELPQQVHRRTKP